MPLLNKLNEVALVGCGGIGCAIAPYLVMAAKKVIFVDGDDFEEKNVPRQFGAILSKGNKAEVLAGYFAGMTGRDHSYIPKMVMGAGKAASRLEECDMIVSGVDNNQTRGLLTDIAAFAHIPHVMAGNEEKNGEAHLNFHTGSDAYFAAEHFDFPDHDRPVVGCLFLSEDKENGEDQTLHANFLASGAAITIINSLLTTEKLKNALAHVALEPRSVTCARVRDLQTTTKSEQ